jgi:hypothetical protein
MKPYQILDCPNLKIIQQQVLSWIHNQSNDIIKSPHLWNKVNTRSLIKECPTVYDYFNSMKLKIRETSLTVINKKEDATLHIDELPVTAKINIPICNTKNTFNRWYEIPKSLMDETKPIINKFGKKFYSFKNVDYSKLKLIGEVELLSPIVFNSQIAHNIVLGENCNIPRIVLASTFFNEPIDFLKD